MLNSDNSPRTAGAAVLGVVMALVMIGTPAAADPPVTPADVHKALGIDTLAADYVLLVDVSASMDGARYEAVKAALRNFLASVAPQDQVSLVTFASTATVVSQGPAGRAPATIVDQLPPNATGTNTDIGRALEAAVSILARDGAPTIGTVVLLTDGDHQPAGDSPFPFTSGYAWDQVTGQAAGLHKDVLTAFAVPLAGVTGAPLLGKVFPHAQTLSETSIDQISQLLDQPKQVVQAAKTRQILGPESATTVQVSWPDQATDLDRGATRLTVTLHSTSAHIPLTVSDFAVTSTEPGVLVEVDSTPVALAPGQSAPVVVTVTWSPGPRDWKPFATVTVDSGLTLSGTVSTPWADALKSDGITVVGELTGGAVTSHGSVQNGQMVAWVVALVILLALVLAGRVAIRRRGQPTLAGVLTAQGGSRGLPLRGRTATISQATLGIGGRGTVRALRDRLLSSQTQLEITYSRDGHPDQQEVQVVRPNESVSVSGVRFEWRRS